MTVLLVAVGAAVGAPVRWWVDRWVQQRWVPGFPWGTFAVNVAGSLLLGALAHATLADSAAFLLVGIGFSGALTTFSSFAWETFRLAEDGAGLFAVLNVVGSLVVCVTSAWCGWLIASAIS